MGAMSSMRHDIPFRDDLNQKPTKTYQEFLERAQGIINAKEAKSLAHKSKIVVLKTISNADQLNGKQNGKNKRREKGNTESAKQAEGRGNYRQDFKKQRLDDEPKRACPQSKYDNYNDLTMSIDEIYHRISARDHLR